MTAPTMVILVDALMASVITWNAVKNMNAITFDSCKSILLINLLLAIGGATCVLSPWFDLEFYEVGHALIDVAFVALMIYGRREFDNFHPREIKKLAPTETA